MLVSADHAALKHAKEAFQRVCVDFAGLAVADIFLGVVNAFMGRNAARELVDLSAVSMERAFAVHVLVENGKDIFALGAADLERADFTAAFDKADHGALMG